MSNSSNVYIKELHITNFGRLHDYSHSFREGLTAIEHENGWGKSTLASFIKAMFYGLPDKGARKGVVYEREKYRPWQGGVYGGSLTFSNGSKSYRIERVFSDRRKSDTFMLFDSVTNTASKDFGENVGDVLFGVNMDTFERSVFVTLDNSKLPSKSDDIAAKLGHLVQNDDMASFTDAKTALEKAANALQGKVKGRGEIPALQAQIESGEASLRLIEGDEKRLEVALRNIENEKAKKAQKEAAQKDLQKEYAEAVYYAKRLQREGLEKDKTQAQEQRLSLLHFFGGTVPSNEVMREMDEALSQYAKNDAYMQSAALKPQEKTEYDSLMAKYQGIMDKDVNKHFGELESLMTLGEKLRALQNEKNEASNALMQKKAVKPQNMGRIAAFALGGVFFVAAAFAFAFMRSLSMIPLLFLGAALLCVLFAIMKKAKPVDTTEEEKCLSDAAHKLDEAEGERARLASSLESFIGKASKSTASLTETLGNMKAALEKLNSYKERLCNAAESRGKRDDASARLLSLTSGFDVDKNKTLESQVFSCRDNKKAFEIANDRAINSGNALEAFDREHKDEMSGILNAQKGNRSSAQLAAAGETARQGINECEKAIARLTSEADNLIANIDTKEQVHGDVAEKKNMVKEKTARYNLLCKTVQFLTEAQEELQRQYMDAMTSGFEKYVQMLGSAISLNITGNLDVTVTDGAITHGREALSDGYKDMVNVCARLALTDALFGSVKPPVILDDPFVNLDDIKVEKAKGAIQYLAKERQVIYLVCHKSRTI